MDYQCNVELGKIITLIKICEACLVLHDEVTVVYSKWKRRMHWKWW